MKLRENLRNLDWFAFSLQLSEDFRFASLWTCPSIWVLLSQYLAALSSLHPSPSSNSSPVQRDVPPASTLWLAPGKCKIWTFSKIQHMSRNCTGLTSALWFTSKGWYPGYTPHSWQQIWTITKTGQKVLFGLNLNLRWQNDKSTNCHRCLNLTFSFGQKLYRRHVICQFVCLLTLS